MKSDWSILHVRSGGQPIRETFHMERGAKDEAGDGSYHLQVILVNIGVYSVSRMDFC